MRVGMFLNYAGGFREAPDEVAELEASGVDLIAVLAMSGALALGEYLAGAIIAVMLTGGAALEHFAVARARRELSALLRRAPRIAHRRSGPDIIDVEIADVLIGDSVPAPVE